MADDSGYSDSNPSGAPPKDKSRGKRALGAAGASLSASGQSMIDSSRDEAESSIRPVSYRKGGKTRKDGPANLHRNERVIPANKRKKVERMMKREKMSLTNRKGRKKARKSSGR